MTAAVYSRNRTLLLCSIGTYAVGVVAGALVVVGTDLEKLTGLADGGATAPGVALSTFGLLANNLTVVGLLLAGVVTFGTLTVLNLLLNGFVHSYTVLALSATPLEFAVLFVPHSVFELPAVWIAGAAGLRVPYRFVRYVRGSEETFLERADARDVLVLALVSAALIVIAAVVEANVSTWLAEVAGVG